MRPDFTCHNNSFFTIDITNQGLSPSTARIGDVAAVLHGGDVPYLLRKIGREDETGPGSAAPQIHARYTFIGECYLPGFMNGEAINEEASRGLQEEVFTLT